MANRKEELELLEAQARERFLNLESADEIKAFLKDNGAYQRDVDRIYRNVKREVQKTFSEQVEADILAGKTLADIRAQLNGKLREDTLESVITSGTQLAKRSVQREVNQMVDEGQSLEAILQRFSLPEIGQDELMRWAEYRHQQNAQSELEAEEGGGSGSIVFGIILIIAGIGLTMASYSSASGGGSYTVWYGLVLYGGYLLIKGFASRA